MAASDGDTVTGRDGDGDDTAVQDTATGPAVTGAGAAGGLSAAAREWVRRTVAELGPLTEEDRDYLAYMFHRRV